MSVTIEAVYEDITTAIGEKQLRQGDELTAPQTARWLGCTVAEAEEVLGYLAEHFYLDPTEDGYRVRKNPGADPELRYSAA